jgi:hypothetical protein
MAKTPKTTPVPSSGDLPPTTPARPTDAGTGPAITGGFNPADHPAKLSEAIGSLLTSAHNLIDTGESFQVKRLLTEAKAWAAKYERNMLNLKAKAEKVQVEPDA